LPFVLHVLQQSRRSTCSQGSLGSGGDAFSDNRHLAWMSNLIILTVAQ